MGFTTNGLQKSETLLLRSWCLDAVVTGPRTEAAATRKVTGLYTNEFHMLIFLKNFNDVFIFEREREREREQADEGQREREAQNLKQAPGSELSAQRPKCP